MDNLLLIALIFLQENDAKESECYILSYLVYNFVNDSNEEVTNAV